MEIKKDFHWVGMLDPDLRVFDIIMMTEFGTTYNAYLLQGSDKTVLFESVKGKYWNEFKAKVEALTPIDKIDYLVVSHTEPDHAGSIEMLLEINPTMEIVGSNVAINFLKEIVNKPFPSMAVKDGDTLSLGDKTLSFISAPHLHWPDTIYTYINEIKTLVTCDSFGSHYSLDEITNDKIVNQADYEKALKYYYDMIIGPFKSNALEAIKKIENLEIETICPGHGPVLVKEPEKIIDIYRKWSTEINPNTKKTVVVPYVTAYGYTEQIAKKIKEGIQSVGDIDVRLYDMVTADSSEVMNDLYWADGILLGTPTIVGDALKPIWDITTSIFSKTHGGKLASAFGSFGWSGEGVPNIMDRLKQLKMRTFEEGLKIKFKPSDDQLIEALNFGKRFGESLTNK